jgi:hypothetical protein
LDSLSTRTPLRPRRRRPARTQIFGQTIVGPGTLKTAKGCDSDCDIICDREEGQTTLPVPRTSRYTSHLIRMSHFGGTYRAGTIGVTDLSDHVVGHRTPCHSHCQLIFSPSTSGLDAFGPSEWHMSQLVVSCDARRTTSSLQQYSLLRVRLNIISQLPKE